MKPELLAILKSTEMIRLYDLFKTKKYVKFKEIHSIYVSNQQIKNILRYFINNGIVREVGDKLYEYIYEEDNKENGTDQKQQIL